jgi:hypothetical protein
METSFKLKNINIIKFWSDFTSLIATLGNIHVHFLFECSILANKLDEIDKEKNFMSQPEFIKKILDYFENP